MAKVIENYETCPYCDQNVFSVALHIAICPSVCEASPEEIEIVKKIEDGLKGMLKK